MCHVMRGRGRGEASPGSRKAENSRQHTRPPAAPTTSPFLPDTPLSTPAPPTHSPPSPLAGADGQVVARWARHQLPALPGGGEEAFFLLQVPDWAGRGAAGGRGEECGGACGMHTQRCRGPLQGARVQQCTHAPSRVRMVEVVPSSVVSWADRTTPTSLPHPTISKKSKWDSLVWACGQWVGDIGVLDFGSGRGRRRWKAGGDTQTQGGTAHLASLQHSTPCITVQQGPVAVHSKVWREISLWHRGLLLLEAQECPTHLESRIHHE